MKEPRAYRIKVEGELSSSWSDRLGGLVITSERREGRRPVTVLEGRLTDQAALAGVLETLYELHLPVISMEVLDPERGADDASGDVAGPSGAATPRNTNGSPRAAST